MNDLVFLICEYDHDIFLDIIIQHLHDKKYVILMQSYIHIREKHFFENILNSIIKKRNDFDFLLFPKASIKMDPFSEQEIVPSKPICTINKYFYQFENNNQFDNFHILVIPPESLHLCKQIRNDIIMKPLEKFYYYFSKHKIFTCTLAIYFIKKYTLFHVSEYNNSFINLELNNEINNIYRLQDDYESDKYFKLMFKQIS